MESLYHPDCSWEGTHARATFRTLKEIPGENVKLIVQLLTGIQTRLRGASALSNVDIRRSGNFSLAGQYGRKRLDVETCKPINDFIDNVAARRTIRGRGT